MLQSFGQEEEDALKYEEEAKSMRNSFFAEKFDLQSKTFYARTGQQASSITEKGRSFNREFLFIYKRYS